jgi:hypothetical protein
MRAWAVLSPEALSELSHEVAGLPSELDPEGEEAKRFDLLVLNLQLAMLRSQLAITLGAAYLHVAVSARQAALFLVGAFAGVVLYHAAFGFTTAWRVFIADRRGAGIRAQMPEQRRPSGKGSRPCAVRSLR